ncbi:hypothetical protein AB5I41_08270 [Sphingomonas sp. MMS24-JH45]
MDGRNDDVVELVGEREERRPGAPPAIEDELAAIVRRSLVGLRHRRRALASFMPLCASDEAIVSVEDLAGELVVSLADRTSARIPAGWSIKRIGEALWREGLALANQGDVNPQSLAGDGDGHARHRPRWHLLRPSAGAGFRLFGADGEARWCDATVEPDLFQAQRLSLGMFGIATEIDCEVVPAFHLAERIEKRPWARSASATTRWRSSSATSSSGCSRMPTA